MAEGPSNAALHAERSVGYAFFAAAFRYPCSQVLEALRERPPFLAGIDGLVQGLTLDALEQEHVRTFGHSIPKEFPPFETEFTSSQSFRQTTELGDIAGFYRAFGVRVAPGTGERMDSIATELEFLHLLAVKAYQAHTLGLAEPAEVVESATRKFLADHVARWVPSFAKRLSAKGGSPLYSALADALGGWIRGDLERLGIPLPPQVDEPALLAVRDWTADAADALEAAEEEEAVARIRSMVRSTPQT